MSTLLRDKLEKEVSTYYASPAAIQEVALDVLEEALNDKIELVDPSNPFIFLLEASAVNTSTSILKCESAMRRLYPVLASTQEDLYRHMSDADYLDRFALPSSSTFTLILDLQQIKKYAVIDDNGLNRKLTIPKDSVITVNGYTWMVLYPVDIVIPENNILTVSFDLTKKTPLLNETSNVINYYTTDTLLDSTVAIELPVYQLNVHTTIANISGSNGYKSRHYYKDKFHYVRVYQKSDVDDVWEEIVVTHNESVYDRTVMTCFIKVLDGYVEMVVPLIYVSNGLSKPLLRVDIFTTKGELDLDLRDFSGSDFSTIWLDLDDNYSKFTRAFMELSQITFMADVKVDGGRDPLELDYLRERVIYRGPDKRAAITFSELSLQLEDRGYSLSKAKDNVSERLFICSRTLPPPDGSTIRMPISVKHGRITLDTTDINKTRSLVKNGLRVTLLNNALFKEENGVTHLLTDAEYYELMALKNTDIAGFLNELNKGIYYYTPFHYILDIENYIHNTRPYFLDEPKLLKRNFVSQNTATSHTATTRDVVIEKLEDRYHLTLEVTVPKNSTGLLTQLQYTDKSNTTYWLAPLHTEELVSSTTTLVTFEILISHDISTTSGLDSLNWIGDGGLEPRVYVELEPTFTVIYYKQLTQNVPSPLDGLLQNVNMVTHTISTVEEFTCTLGSNLSALFSRARQIPSTPVYRRYQGDVEATYETTVYELDDDGSYLLTEDPNTGRLELTVKYQAGTVKRDSEGNALLIHRAGDVILDENGNPILEEGELALWEIQPLMLDARYYFATSEVATEYRSYIGPTVLRYLTEDIEQIQETLMARTELEYLPNASTGTAVALVENRLNVNIDTALSFQITFVVTPIAYSDRALRSAVIEETYNVLNDLLYNNKFSVSILTQRLMDIGDYIISAIIENPIDGHEYAYLLNEEHQFSLRSKIIERPNGELDVLDDVNIVFTTK